MIVQIYLVLNKLINNCTQKSYRKMRVTGTTNIVLQTGGREGEIASPSLKNLSKIRIFGQRREILGKNISFAHRNRSTCV